MAIKTGAKKATKKKASKVVNRATVAKGFPNPAVAPTGLGEVSSAGSLRWLAERYRDEAKRLSLASPDNDLFGELLKTVGAAVEAFGFGTVAEVRGFLQAARRQIDALLAAEGDGEAKLALQRGAAVE